MAKQKKQEIPMWAKTGHSKPVTRRDFLGAGLIPFAATVALPNWAQMLFGSTAQAADSLTCPQVGSSMIPFISLNLSGGGGLASNYVPMDVSGNPLPSLSLIHI